MATREYEGKRFEHNIVECSTDTLTVEEALHISLNDDPFTITMRTPGDDKFLIRGLLHAEGVIRNTHVQPEFVIEKSKGALTTVNVLVDESDIEEGYTNSRSLLSVSSCGICGKTELEELVCDQINPLDNTQIEIEAIQTMFTRMQEKQNTFKLSGGSHASGAFDANGKLICMNEDMGRHNAVDKVVGELIYLDRINDAKCLTVSGRISYEIIVKCFKARIPILAAVSAPSSLAVDYAKELGITLLAFCRNNRATCYSNTYRIKNLNLKNQAG